MALEEYSQAEYTNITNLKRQREAEGNMKKQIEESQAQEKIIHEGESDTNSFWKKSIEAEDDFRSFFRLRWSSIGYHYDWTERRYKQNAKSKFPVELKSLCQALANLVSSRGGKIEENLDDYEPEAAIVNYYPVGSCMGGHLDDAEQALTKPIVSMSIGCPAVFLLGGKSKETKPVPILLQSGDILIMSGESRYCYHGIAYVMSQSALCNLVPTQLTSELRYTSNEDSSDLDHILKYLNVGRININARQVANRIDEGDGLGKKVIWEDKHGTIPPPKLPQ